MDEQASINKTALSATLHCLTGCSIGEVAGMVIGSLAGLSNLWTVAISVILAFIFGYGLSLMPVLKAGVVLKTALLVVLAADTLSILTMEIVDNLVMLGVPGAIQAGLGDPLFWGSLALSLLVAFWAAFPVNRYLLRRGKGHALMHEYHHHDK